MNLHLNTKKKLVSAHKMQFLVIKNFFMYNYFKSYMLMQRYQTFISHIICVLIYQVHST